MASNFIEGTSPLSGPAFIHLDTSLLMVLHIATSGCLNLFACFSWPAPLSASILFWRGLLFSSFNSLYHMADASNLPCWPATVFFTFPVLPVGIDLLVFQPSLLETRVEGQRSPWWQAPFPSFFLHCITLGCLCLYKVTSCLWEPYVFPLPFLFSVEPMDSSLCTIPVCPNFIYHSLVK